MTSLPFVIAVVGPTASGKTDVAQKIALQVSGEVVSADSMQIYRGMDIGTGKLPVNERLVPHHGFDLVDPGQPFSAALYQEYARSCFAEIRGRGNTPVLCGGTGFYVRAAIDDYRFPKGEQVGNAIRDKYHEFLHVNGAQALWDLLNEKDPTSAKIIPPADSKRVVRAFELLHDGTSYAQQKAKLASIPQIIPARFIGLQVDPDILRARIDKRVDAMFEGGFLEEVRTLLIKGFRDGVTAPQAIGYKEVVAAFDGDISMDEAREKMKVATHRYAKRQRTWFRKDKRIKWLNADSGDADQLTKQSVAWLTSC